MKRLYSLKNNKDIVLVLKKGKRIYKESFTIYFLKNDLNTNFHYAISVSKKLLKSDICNKVLKAPKRNYYKRVISNIIYDLFKKNLINSKLNFFIICKHEILDKNYLEIYKELESSFNIINRKYF